VVAAVVDNGQSWKEAVPTYSSIPTTLLGWYAFGTLAGLVVLALIAHVWTTKAMSGELW